MEQAARVAGPRFGDRALAAPAAGGPLARHQAEKAGRPVKARKVTDLVGQAGGAEGVDAYEATQSRDRPRHRAGGNELVQALLEMRASLLERPFGGQIVTEGACEAGSSKR